MEACYILARYLGDQCLYLYLSPFNDFIRFGCLNISELTKKMVPIDAYFHYLIFAITNDDIPSLYVYFANLHRCFDIEGIC